MLPIPRVLPWARCFCPFRACGAELQDFCLNFQDVLSATAETTTTGTASATTAEASSTAEAATRATTGVGTTKAGTAAIAETTKVAAVECVGVVIAAGFIVALAVTSAKIAVGYTSACTIARIPIVAVIPKAAVTGIPARIAASISYMPNHRATPIPWIVISTPAIIPWTVPATIPTSITIIPWIVPRVKPRIIPAGIISVTPRIAPSPHTAAPVIRTIAVIVIEPRIIISIPTAHFPSTAEVFFRVSIFLCKISIIIDTVRSNTLSYMKLDDIITQGIFPYILIMTQESTTAVIFIHVSVASTPVQGIYTVSTCFLLGISTL